MAESNRADLISERTRERIWALSEAYPYEAPSCYWLDSDCGASFCREHAIEARAKEFGFGPLLRDPAWYRRNEMDDAFFEGVSSGRDGESDTCETCDVCGKTLSYVLTDYGATSELDHFLAHPPAALSDEIVYEMDRVSLNVSSGTPRGQLLDTTRMVNSAWRVWREQNWHDHGAAA